jgi:L-2-hydroxyglutarate oxidase
VIVATRETELPELEKLFARGQENGLAVKRLAAKEVTELEPHVRCRAGLRVPTTGITDYRAVSRKYLELFQAHGGEAKFGSAVRGVNERGGRYVVETTSGDYETKFLINCGGLHSDRLARLSGANPNAKIVPFRGEYYELIPEKRYLVKGLIYPVPNPKFPFLGVHFTRMIDGSVHAGPNAVLAFKREGYRKTDFSLRDFAETMAFRGFRKLAYKNFGEGMKEMYRSLVKGAFVRSLQQLIPEVQSRDLVPCRAGVRAQALTREGKLVDDFLIVRQGNSLHVCNAPSPAATASLEIGAEICRQVPVSATKPVALSYAS